MTSAFRTALIRGKGSATIPFKMMVTETGPLVLGLDTVRALKINVVLAVSEKPQLK